jgi:hypothetical protein
MQLTNTQFEFASSTKRVLLGGMVLGLICLVLTFVGDDQFHTRFWTNYLHNSVYFTGISFMSLAFLCAIITAFGGWMTAFRRIWEAMAQFIWVGIVLFSVLVIGVWGHLHHLYHWNVPGVATLGDPNYDKILAGKVGFLNPVWYTVGTIGFLALWYFFAVRIRKNSVEQDTNETPSLQYYKNQRKWAAAFLPIIGFLVCVFIWQSVMSIDSHWYSTMFAWYSMISLLLGAISMTVMLIIYLKSKGYLAYVSRDHLHDVGKFLFGISVFWTYLWFDQFMLIWYANNGEETIYFRERMDHYPVLFWGNLLLNFITPFFILMRNSTKRKFGTMFFVAAVVFFGHWWDFFYMIKPGARLSAEHALHGPAHGATHHEVAPMPGHGDTHATEPKAAATAAHDHGTADHKQDHAADSHAAAAHGAEAKPAEGKPAEAAPAAHADAAHADHAAPHGDAKADAAHADHGDAHGDAHGGGHDVRPFMMGFTIPGLQEIGIMLGFLSLFLFFFFSQLERASLIPWRDPFLEESLHHETGAMIESEQEEKAGHDHH